ncbi:MAG: macro domain-containing protein [Clostridia bacterium]|nr:macro domain-containing protein [Clostridia bacterium]
MDKRAILNDLMRILTNFLKIKVNFGKNYENDRQVFRGLCNQCLTLKGIDEKFYKLQDELLSLEREEKGIVDINEFEYKGNIALWQGDITRLKADAIVNAANDQYLGCFVPCHNCIDNIIMSTSGFQMRDELLKLKEQPDFESQRVKVTKGHNLPSKFVFHVAGPEIFGEVSQKDKNDLRDCYQNCLDKAKEMKLSGLVFCCISTGVYSFPNDEACKIAVATVKEWMQQNKTELKVVFNVFKDIDKGLYEREIY